MMAIGIIGIMLTIFKMVTQGNLDIPIEDMEGGVRNLRIKWGYIRVVHILALI
jgi:hypothetical protein